MSRYSCSSDDVAFREAFEACTFPPQARAGFVEPDEDPIPRYPG